jgi:Isy1-like splicing family
LKGLDDVEVGKSKKGEQVLDAEYYGVSEDADEKLLKLEKTAELEWIEKEKQFDAHLKSQRHAQDASAPSALDMTNASVETPLHVPTQTEIEVYLLERRKQACENTLFLISDFVFLFLL